jgi:hypothetical protein
LNEKLNEAEQEHINTKKLYCNEEGNKDYTKRMTTASDMRKQTEDIFGQVNCANDILSKLMGDCKKAELLKEVHTFSFSSSNTTVHCI